MNLPHCILKGLPSVYNLLPAVLLKNTPALAVAIFATIVTTVTSSAQVIDVPSHLGPFEVQLRTNNPLREAFNVNYRPSPAALDIDNDGDTDVVVADYDGGNGFSLLRNDGSASSPAFNQALYTTNPFQYVSFDDGATLTFADVDGDADLDLLFGTIDGTFRYYRRNSSTSIPWTLQSGPWNATTKTGNPLYGIDLGDFTSPVFNDMDNDGDLDLVIGSSYQAADKSVHFYVNDGQYNFTPSTLIGINPDLAETTPTFLDVDNDGDEDLILGADDGKLYYFKRTGQLAFEQQTGADNPFDFFYRGQFSSPSAADFDNDGDKDMVVGVADNIIDFAYIENKGSGIFEEKTSFENPFGGASVMSESSPYFVDVDRDGDKDFVMGSSDNSDPYLRYFKNENGIYSEVVANNPFSGVTVANTFVPSFVDMDGDGDDDLLATADNSDMTFIYYFKNENGSYVKQDSYPGPFEDVYLNEGRGDFADLDRDGDFDFIGTDRRWEMGDDRYFIRYFENTGTPTAPAFTEKTGVSNPLNIVLEDFELFPRFFDIDHDGDLDALIGESGNTVENSDGNEFHLYENVSTTQVPVFRYRGNLIQQGTNPFAPAPSFVDQDGDGDLDIFFGNAAGQLSFYKNENPPAILTLNATALAVAPGTTVTIDPLVTLSDADSDSVVTAEISIGGYTAGNDILAFTPVNGIEGNFNTLTGILRFIGKAPLADYQRLLRSVTLKHNSTPASGGRTKESTITRTVTVRVSDADKTNSAPRSRTINFVSASTPVFSDQSANLTSGGSTTVDLNALISDADNDVDFTTLAIVQNLTKGTATLTGSTLSLNFVGVNFAGTQTITLTVCDGEGLCDQATITVNVSNSAPTFSSASKNVNAGSVATLDLKSLIVDSENNVDLTTLAITQKPGSGAITSIDANKILSISYQNLSFSGSETVQVRVCDMGEACATSTITIQVLNTAPVFNSTTATVPYHGTATVDLSTLITDAESNINFSTVSIVSGSTAGGIATFAGNILSIHYAEVNRAGADEVHLRVCDLVGLCDDAIISIIIQNAPPVITPEPLSSQQGASKSLNLLDVTSDADGNLDLSTFSIIQSPQSGAKAQIDVISSSEVRLTVDYSGIQFSGRDQLTIRACDVAGACTENSIAIDVNSAIQVYNAVAPNSTGDNRFFRILNLPAENKVTIFNRWGDVVYHANDYDNDAVKFEGNGSNGNALTSGTYFYKVEYYDLSVSLKTITGYLSLKQ